MTLYWHHSWFYANRFRLILVTMQHLSMSVKEKIHWQQRRLRGTFIGGFDMYFYKEQWVMHFLSLPHDQCFFFSFIWVEQTFSVSVKVQFGFFHATWKNYYLCELETLNVNLLPSLLGTKNVKKVAKWHVMWFFTIVSVKSVIFM